MTHQLKVEIFSDANSDRLQANINEWLHFKTKTYKK
jgi:hypothetical protein